MAAEPTRARRLVLLRHGRTAWNASGRAQGHADVELDDDRPRAGRRRWRRTSPRWTPAALWTSDLARARQTAAYVERATGLAAEDDERLREYDVGERQGMTRAEFERSLPGGVRRLARAATRRTGSRAPRSTAEVAARIVPALRECLDVAGAGGDRHRGHPRRLPQGRAGRAAGLAARPGADAARAGQLRLGDAWSSRPAGGCGWRPTTGVGQPAAASPTCDRQRRPDFASAAGGWLRFPSCPRRSQGGGAVAQLVAHLHGMEGVRGSSPLSSTHTTPDVSLDRDPRDATPSHRSVRNREASVGDPPIAWHHRRQQRSAM